MTITLNDITPIGLCIATQDLFDAKRFQQNFCDNLLLRSNDQILGSKLINIKRELNSSVNEKKYLEGHKTAIISNIDKIISLVISRYSGQSMMQVEKIVNDAKELINKILFATTFDHVAALEPQFKTKVTLPIYSMFIDDMRRSRISIL